MKTKIRIEDLEKIIKSAKEELRHNNEYVACIEIESGCNAKQQGESDSIRASIQSANAEHNSKTIAFINF